MTTTLGLSKLVLLGENHLCTVVREYVACIASGQRAHDSAVPSPSMGIGSFKQGTLDVDMQAAYPTTYRDAHGEIATTIENDGQTLRVSLRGVELEGSDFDSLEPVRWSDPVQLSRFSLAGGSLCACTLEFSMPVTVLTEAGETRANLEVHLVLGRARANGGLDEETLRLALMADGVRFESVGLTGWFEDELADIQRKLPSGWHLGMCFGCALSDYSPVGHGLFGGLACFRDNKAAYRAVKSKIDLFNIWDTLTEFVQETHLCPEFEKRIPGAGYRG